MIKVLHVMAGADAGGISSVVLNYYKYINKEKIHFDVAITLDIIGLNGRRLMELGVKIYKIPLKSKDITLYKAELKKLLLENKYDAVHVHENETSYVALKLAKELGIPCRIAHAHTASPYTSVKGEIRRLSGCILNAKYATNIIGCGKLAGERIFGRSNMKSKKAFVLPNSIDTDVFCYDSKIREETRKELSVNNKYVVGMVGRIAPPKNNVYAIELFKQIKEKIENAVLVIAGNGPDEKDMLETIKEKGLEQDVIYLGRRDDVNRLYQAYDIYFLPSLFEGYPVAAVEAMAAGLPVMLSDTITRELEFGSAVNYISLNEKKEWAEVALRYVKDTERSKRADEVKRNGLDIHDTVDLLEKIYESNFIK